MAKHADLEVSFLGVIDGEAKFDFHCKSCGSYAIKPYGEPGDMAMLRCSGCEAVLGRLGALKVRCAYLASQNGVKVELPADVKPIDPDTYLAEALREAAQQKTP